jgi:hypothetical protein
MLTKEQMFMRYILTVEHEFFIGYPDRITDAIDHADEFNIPRMIEKALAFQSNGLYTFVDADGYDFSDFSDAKTSSVRMNDHYRRRCSVSITSIGNKIGALRTVVFNPFTESIDYFYIPKNNVMQPYDCTNGSVEFKSSWSHKNGYNRLERYRVPNFKALAQMK